MNGHQGGKAAGDGGGDVMNCEIGIDIYTLICIKWITNKSLLYKKISKLQKFKKEKKYVAKLFSKEGVSSRYFSRKVSPALPLLSGKYKFRAITELFRAIEENTHRQKSSLWPFSKQRTASSLNVE